MFDAKRLTSKTRPRVAGRAPEGPRNRPRGPLEAVHKEAYEEWTGPVPIGPVLLER